MERRDVRESLEMPRTRAGEVASLRCVRGFRGHCAVRCPPHRARGARHLAAVLQLCAAGKLRCSEKTRRPSAATIRTVAEALVAGDFYPRRGHRLLRLAVLLQAGGLARLEGSRLTLPRGPQGHRPTRPRVGPWAVGPTRPRVGPWAVGTLAAARPDRRVQPGGADQGPEVRRGAERSRAAPPGRGCRAGPLPGGRVDWCGRLVRPRCAAPT